MRKLSAFAAFAFVISGTSTAQAQWYRTPAQIKKIKKVEWKIKAYQMNIHNGVSTIRFVKRHAFYYTPTQVTQIVGDHKWMVRFSRTQIQQLRLSSRPPHYSQWLCIHRYEGSWTDSGDPYWGGLQMDRGFMLTYAPRSLLSRGWANTWTPIEQMWVAERAYSARGFSPWPNTARSCGLL